MTVPRAKIVRRFAGGHIPLIALSPGGVAEGDTSQGLEAAAWVCWVDARDSQLKIDRVGDRPVNFNAPVVSFLESVNGSRFSRLSLCFDQNARRVVAWSENDTVTVSRVAIAGTEERQQWSGVDGLLFFDGLLLDSSGGDETECIVWYLSTDRTRVLFRLQSDNYAIEYTYAILPEPCSLDQIARTNNAISLYLSPKNKRPVIAVISAPYPVRVKDDALGITAGIVSGELFEIIVKRDPVLEPLTFDTSLSSGAYFEVIVKRDAVLEPFAFGAALSSGVYVVAVVSIDAVLEPFTFGAALSSGVYVDVIVSRDAVLEPFTFGASFVGGSYV